MAKRNDRSYSVVRTEKKYEMPIVSISVLSGQLRKLMQADTHGGSRGYAVRSLYFDSIYDDDLFDKINGLEVRKKVRLRLYDPESPTVKLELKQKQGTAQMKKTLEIPQNTARAMIAGDYTGLLTLDDDFALELYQLLLTNSYRPKCIIEYDRLAFAAPVNDTRITVDSDIRVSRDFEAFFRRQPNYTPIVKHPVLEVKYNRFLLDRFKLAADLADMPEMSCSKYELARSVIG